MSNSLVFLMSNLFKAHFAWYIYCVSYDKYPFLWENQEEMERGREGGDLLNKPTAAVAPLLQCVVDTGTPSFDNVSTGKRERGREGGMKVGRDGDREGGREGGRQGESV